ncbi:Envelope fusion protein [Papilio xuthus]|uniref:Envelope fusion protein n=1 Tax=Papilio xuthus TaxID=66420 RepID=A0A194QHD0_PAPXU|nr:Envelope fusion protein [Papilio xuthus]
MLSPLQSLYNDVSRDFTSISHIISNKISKRSAWFSGIGTAFKHIFGTLDEEDSENYNKAIQALYNNDAKLTKSITKSVMVSQSALSSVNKSLIELNLNQAKLNDVVEQLILSNKNMSNEINKLSFKAKLNQILNILQSNLMTISFKVEDLLNAILFVKNNNLHPSILTPRQLYNDITNNLKIIPKFKDLPVPLEISNIHTLMNIADLTCYYLEDKFMFIVKIPLVSLLEYNLYKNVPLPTPRVDKEHNSFAMLIPFEPFLALSKDKTSYAYLRSLDNCKHILADTYLCEISDTYTVFTNPSCEIEIITKALKSLPESCPVKLLFGNVDIWHKLRNNKWIFVQSNPTKLSIECNDQTLETTILGTGFLEIQPNCIAFHKNLKLIPKLYPKINVPKIVSEFNIISDDCCNLNQTRKNSVKITLPKIKTVSLDDLIETRTNYNQIIENLENVETTNPLNHVAFPILSIISIVLILCLVIVYICKRKSKLQDVFKLNKTTKTEDSSEPDIELPQSAPRIRIN